MFWRICLLSRVGRLDDAVQALRQALDRGWCYGEQMLTQDTDLEPLHGRSDWDVLVGESTQKQRDATPPPGVFLPRRVDGDASLFALHAAVGRASDAAAAWEPVTRMGFDLYAPSATTMVSNDRASWDTIEVTARALADDLAAVSGSPTVFTGRSRGAVRAAQLAARHVSTTGVILVAHAPSSDDCPELNVPTYLIGGAEDPPVFLDAIDAFASYQQKRGIPVENLRIAGMGHWYPDDFPSRIETALTWLASHQ